MTGHSGRSEENAEKRTDYVTRLTHAVRDYIRDDMVNHYTALSPKRASDGSMSMTVKDRRHSGELEIIVREKNAS